MGLFDWLGFDVRFLKVHNSSGDFSVPEMRDGCGAWGLERGEVFEWMSVEFLGARAAANGYTLSNLQLTRECCVRSQ